jgi:uncharacterized membrane protein YhaH (DUF805 family)
VDQPQAAWCRDPSSRHEYRWWDGGSWTEHVANGGVSGVDPYTGPNVPPPPTGPEVSGSAPRLTVGSTLASTGFAPGLFAAQAPAPTSFADAVKICFSKYATFSGRASRSEYWWFVLFIALSSVALGLAAVMLGADEETVEAVLWLGFFVVFLPYLAVAVRRLHDVSMSGWWLVIWLFPFVGGIVLLALFTSRTRPEINIYGPPPSGLFG